MNQLVYNTRGGSDPSGKARVYIACHPADRALYCEQIAGDVLQLHNCAVWSVPEGGSGVDAADMADVLGHMQLIVVPVTTRLLTEPNHAMDAEIPFAISNNIPVLPLMQEEGLDELFYSRFGDMQYLDPNQRDNTAISYVEKLSKYLNSVLVGDELAEKIRSAFDAYVFLSYRKKDRREANELMRLIHKNDFCRDIAIWYDEYLVPGEGFNQAISDALNRCRLFAMVVTPNLVNEKNYVMTTEYPAAIAAHKPVLPIEAVRTDRDALADNFAGIGECVPCGDAAALSERLKELFGDIARERGGSDPVHDYFIGLAYLEGIDVETDHNRAFELIYSAAEMLLSEAMRKLADMYCTGQGVERDYDKALIWLRNIVEVLRIADKPEQLMQAYLDCGNALYEMGRIQEAGNLFSEMSAAAEDIVDANGFRFWQAEADYMRAIIAAEQGAVSEAETCCSRAMQVYLAMPVSFECYLKTMNGCLLLGEICARDDRLDEAMEWYESALSFFEAARLLAPNVERAYDARENHAVIHLAMGNLELKRKRLNSAEELARKGLALMEELFREYPRVGINRNIMRFYGFLGDVAIAAGNLSKARENYHNAAAIANDTDERTGSIQAQADICDILNKLGRLELQLGDAMEARSYFESQVQYTELLLERYQQPSLRHKYAFGLRFLGDAEYKLGRPDEAHRLYLDALKQFDILAQNLGPKIYRRDRINTYYRLGDIDLNAGRLDAASVYYEKCISTAEEAGENITREEYINCTLVARERLARIHVTRGKVIDGKREIEKCVSDLRYITELNGDIQDRHNLAVDLVILGDIEMQLGNRQSAAEKYHEGMEISIALTRETDVPEYRRDLSIVCEKLGSLAFAMGRYDDVPAFYARCRIIREELVRENGTHRAYCDLWSCYIAIGDVAFPQKQMSAARLYYKKAFEIALQHFTDSDYPENRRNLAFSYDRMGLMDYLEGDHRSAYTYVRKARDMYAQLMSEDGRNAYIREYLLCEMRLGSIQRELSRLSDAMETWRHSLETAVSIYDTRRTAEAGLDMLTNLYALAETAAMLRCTAEAKEYCQMYIQFAGYIHEKERTDTSRALLERGYELMRRIG